MRRFFKVIALGVVMMVAVACNIDEEYNEEIPAPEVRTIIVYDYTPAPGQFVGDRKFTGFEGVEDTPEAAREYAEKRLNASKMISLGAFGGYVVMGLGKSIENKSGYDFAITGNSFDGSSEPGVVWVMADENGNGEPDDVWRELEGSESFSKGTIHNYEVTYYRPTAPMMNVEWTDNQGGSGVVEHVADYHEQEYYYPQWVKEDSYTLRGKCLKSKSYEESGTWRNPAFEWGYADNASAECLKGENLFDISRAVDATGEPIVFERVDFVMVQCAVMQQCGWAGEVSTEISGFRIVE